MKSVFVMTLFMLATLAWAAAQQSGSAPDRNSGQTTSPAQAPGTTQTQPSTPGASDRANAPVTEGCLGGSAPNYTIKDKTGTAYKLNMPPNADTSKLAPHIGESVQVQGNVKDAGTPNASIDVQAIGRGTGTCPGSGSRNAQPQPK